MISPERLSDSARSELTAIESELKMRAFISERKVNEALQILCENGSVKSCFTAKLKLDDGTSSPNRHVQIVNEWVAEAERNSKDPSDLVNEMRKTALSEVIDSLLKCD